MNKLQEEIDAKKKYSVRELHDLGVFDTKFYTSSIKLVLEDKATVKVLNADILGTSHSRRYFIKGRNVIKFLTNKQDGKKTKGST